VFVLSKIDEILAWERTADQERDTRFVDLGRYLCEVRAGQYWRLDNLRSFDEFLERKFPESRRKAYYLMAIHEHLPRIPKADLRSIGWTKARELAHPFAWTATADSIFAKVERLCERIYWTGH
jgi:hypothetical protein